MLFVFARTGQQLPARTRWSKKPFKVDVQYNGCNISSSFVISPPGVGSTSLMPSTKATISSVVMEKRSASSFTVPSVLSVLFCQEYIHRCAVHLNNYSSQIASTLLPSLENAFSIQRSTQTRIISLFYVKNLYQILINKPFNSLKDVTNLYLIFA